MLPGSPEYLRARRYLARELPEFMDPDEVASLQGASTVKDDFLCEILDAILGDGSAANRETFADLVNKALARIRAERAASARRLDALRALDAFLDFGVLFDVSDGDTADVRIRDCRGANAAFQFASQLIAGDNQQ